jgi:hypothetical protein
MNYMTVHTLREYLGSVVRETWIHWARVQPNAKPSWVVPYEELREPDKEVDRQIGVDIALTTVNELMDLRDLLYGFAELYDDNQAMEAVNKYDELTRKLFDARRVNDASFMPCGCPGGCLMGSVTMRKKSYCVRERGVKTT